MGAASEIAVKQAMEASGSFRDGTVQYGDVEQDLEGNDIVGQLKQSGEWIGIDAKAGAQIPELRRSESGVKITVGAPTQLIDNHYRMEERGIDGLAFQINTEIKKIKTSATHHKSRQRIQR
jgi:hypothetical protein